MRISQENVHCRRTEGAEPPSPQRAQATHRLRFPKSFRILKRGAFVRVSKSDKRFLGSLVAFTYSPAPAPRLGITATRKYGNAIKRNRFKRLVREAFRTSFSKLPPIEIVVYPKAPPEAFTFKGIVDDFSTLIGHYAQSAAEKSR